MNSSTTVVDLRSVLRRGWWMLVLFSLVGGIAGLGVQQVWPQQYEASAVITVPPTSDTDEVQMETERVVASSTAVVAAAADEVDGWSTEDIRSALEVTVPKDSEILVFTATSSNPSDVAAVANAAASAYNDRREDLARTRTVRAQGQIEDEIRRLQDRLRSLPSEGERRRTVRLLIVSLQRQLTTEAVSTFESGEMVSPAQVPQTTTAPGTAVYLVGGLALGLAAGFMSALLVRGGPPRATGKDGRSS